MWEDKKTEKITLRYTPTEVFKLEGEARRMGYVAQTGKKSVLLSSYIREKSLAREGKLLKLDGRDEIDSVWNDIRNTMKMISYFHYLTKTANEEIRSSEHLKQKYGDIPYLQEEYLTHIETLCKDADESAKKIFEELIKMNKQLIKLEEREEKIIY